MRLRAMKVAPSSALARIRCELADASRGQDTKVHFMPRCRFRFQFDTGPKFSRTRICLTFRAVHVRPAVQLVAKSVNSAFIGTDLDLRLRCPRANAVVVFGMRTDMCVSSTAHSAANLGWPVNVVRDACDCCYTPCTGWRADSGRRRASRSSGDTRRRIDRLSPQR